MSPETRMPLSPEPPVFQRAATWQQSMRYAWNGLCYVVRTQRNFQIHLMITVGVLSAGSLLGITLVEWCLVLILIGGMLALECLNTAIEAVVDLAAGSEYYELAKISKDVSAAACWLGALTSAIVGLIVFVPYILALLVIK